MTDKTTNIIVTQIINNVIVKPAKKYPKTAAVVSLIAVISTCLTILNGANQLHDSFINFVYPDKIYLSLWETGKKIPIKDYPFEIPPITPIKPNEPITLRFILTQDNTNAPQIVSITLTFPDDAKVTPIPYNGWSWERNNDVANRYFLNFTSSQVLANGSDYNLPALNVIFPKVGQLPFSYQINSNKLKPIRRDFTINTALKYDEWKTKRQYYPMGENVPIVSQYYPSSATPQTVMVRTIDISTVTPDTKLSTEQKTK